MKTRPRSVTRSRWAAIGAAIAVSLGGGGVFVAGAVEPSAPSSVVTIDPVRILDTRDPVNLGLPGPFVSAVSQKLQVTGSVATTSGLATPVPSGATGVLLNVTAVGPTAEGFISVRPGDATGSPPKTSNLNFSVNETAPNSVQVALPTTGANAGKLDITYDALGVAGPTTDVLVDVMGYLVPGGGGAQGPPGPVGPTGPAAPGSIGPVALTGLPDTSCADAPGQQVWANTNVERQFVVVAAQDGTGYYVTRYDLDGTFTTVVGARNPGCGFGGDTFTAAGVGTTTAVWTKFVDLVANPTADYDPDAVLPATATWDDMLTAFFSIDPSIPATVSYEFDYYNACGDHWRDAFYGATAVSSGNIADCP